MSMKNKYVEHAHISERKFRDIIRYFAVDLDASQIARLTGISRNTVNRYLKALRQRLVEYCDTQSPVPPLGRKDALSLGVNRLPSPSRGQAGKSLVFGIFQVKGQIYTEIIPECVKGQIQPLVRGRADIRSVIDPERWRGYNALVDVGSGRHVRIDLEGNSESKGRQHINGVEGFWGYAKNRLVRSRGMRPQAFNLHLKECEFRYNNKVQSLYPLLLKILRYEPLKLNATD